MAREGFDEFASAAATRLYRTAYLMVGDHHMAEDLVQDVLARVYVAWPRIQGDPHGYAYRAVGHAVTNQRRWWGRHPESALTDDDDRPSAEDVSESVAVQLELLDALGRLPPRQRVTVVLRYYADLSEAETAGALGVSIGTVKSQHARAMATLRRLLGRDLALPPDPDTSGFPAIVDADSILDTNGARHDPRPA